MYSWLSFIFSVFPQCTSLCTGITALRKINTCKELSESVIVLVLYLNLNPIPVNSNVYCEFRSSQFFLPNEAEAAAASGSEGLFSFPSVPEGMRWSYHTRWTSVRKVFLTLEKPLRQLGCEYLMLSAWDAAVALRLGTAAQSGLLLCVLLITAPQNSSCQV